MTSNASDQRTVTFRWEALTVAVRYHADWSSLSKIGSDRQVAHIAIQTVEPPNAPLPVTETGYLSHFLAPALVDQTGGRAAFVRGWLDEEARRPACRRADAARRQLDLFD